MCGSSDTLSYWKGSWASIDWKCPTFFVTCQLPMGVGRCHWGGFTDRNVCYIHGAFFWWWSNYFASDHHSNYHIYNHICTTLFFIHHNNITLASCPWGPVTANGADLLTEIYVIYMETHTSHRATARCFDSGTFTNFGTLPATLASCQYWETYLECASHRSLSFGNMPKLVGMLPKVPHLTLPGPE